MTPNEPLLIEVLAHVVAFPDTWNQADWLTPPPSNRAVGKNAPFVPECGTAFCVAGYVGYLDGLQFAYDGSWNTNVVTPDGTLVPINEYAVERLGLDWHQAPRLFTPDNTSVDDLFSRVASFLAPLDEQVLRDKVYDRASQLTRRP